MVLCEEVLINVICVISTKRETVDKVVAAPMHTAGQSEFEWTCPISTVDGKLECSQKWQHILKYRRVKVYTGYCTSWLNC